ncbi:hypothetical protein M3Y94_00001600 [Aphelenchoides besseyi]|nr:hypothetical protein M3Y94_00001600 [Aphelenchoides besseyi]
MQIHLSSLPKWDLEVKLEWKESITLKVNRWTTIKDVKEIIRIKEGIPIEGQKLIVDKSKSSASGLADDLTLDELRSNGQFFVLVGSSLLMQAKITLFLRLS